MLHVSPAGPIRSIQKAIDQAGPGTLIKIGEGVYREELVFKTSGAEEEPIILQGAVVAKGGQGTVIELAAVRDLKWEEAPDWGDGVYRAKTGGIRMLYANGKEIPHVRYTRTHPNPEYAKHQKNPVWHHSNLFRHGVRWNDGCGFTLIKALWMHHPPDNCTYLKFGDNSNPNEMEIRTGSGSPVLTLENVSHITVQDLHLRFANTGVWIDHCTNIVVRNCRMYPAEYGVTLRRSARCRILNNEMARGAVNSMDPFENRDSAGKTKMDLWDLHKKVGDYDSHGVCVASCLEDNEIAFNYIHDQWDGVQCYFMGSRRLKVHDNCILRCLDDGLVFNAQCPDQEWYSNTVVRAFASFRIYPAPLEGHKPPKTLEPSGPVYIYRNVFINGYQENIRLWNDSLAHAYIYHNTVMGRHGLSYLGQAGIGVPNYHIFNNRFYDNYLAIMRQATTKPLPNFQADYNCYMNDRHKLIPTRGIEPHGTRGRDFVDKGVDLSTFFGKPLPGCEPGYFKGRAPDCGAHEEGSQRLQPDGLAIRTPLGVFEYNTEHGGVNRVTVEVPEDCGPRTHPM
ncbi:MAG: right-handed parallel beta-helix repeat-containing protein [Kiritimatiellae bacterium]|nr:right-handed parallel beta-helix repeat-containing protein [Kiritimatiellia bacterium]